MDSDSSVSIQDYLASLRRRRLLMSWVFLATLLAAIALMATYPERYRSSALIYIETPEISDDIIETTVRTSDRDLRIDRVSDRALRGANLLAIVDEYSLYPSLSPEERTGELFNDIEILKISDTNDPRVQFRAPQTIGFSISYLNESPTSALQVTERLAELFLQENVASRTETVAETSSFLAEQAERLQADLARTELVLAQFKQDNAGSLPEETGLNTQILQRTEADLASVEREMRTLQERKNLLLAEITQTSPSATLYSETGEPILGAEDQLAILQRQYVSMAARYSPDHPDVVQMRREIELLSNGTQRTATAESLQIELLTAEAELTAARQRYGEEHPDVRRLNRTVEGLQTRLDASDSEMVQPAAAAPDNPIYIQLQIQLDSADIELLALRTLRTDLRSKLTDYEGRLARTPEIERQLITLTRDYEIAGRDYNDIRVKQADAERAIIVESEQRAERYVLQRTPRLPAAPAEPSHITFLFAAIFLAFTVAISSGLVREAVDANVRGAKDVRALLEMPPIAIVPIIENSTDRWHRLIGRAALAASFATVAVLAAFTVA